jgi:hypothetical protein
VFIAESPLFEITTKDKIYFAYNEFEKADILKNLGTQKYTLQRSKGLGENEPEMMWQTTMNPETRRLISVTPADAKLTEEIFDTLMGDNLPARKIFIAEHGSEYLKDADNYPILDRDLLLTAAMFHDVGKLAEISAFPENDYTDAGQLLGHIYIGADWLSKRMDKIGGFTVKRKNELLHCILSHHGELEYGSPKKPALAEALALSMADNLDAKIAGVTALFDGTEENGWLGYQKMFESNMRKTGK